MMNKTYKYKAFISYSHKDKTFAKWLHKEIENYRIPKTLREKYRYLPKDLKRTVFRDDEELSSASVLSEALKEALACSEKLIIVCSPDTVNSQWVEDEIMYFKEEHGEDQLFAIVKSGEPQEVLPTALNGELLAVDARSQRKVALLKIIAAILEVDYADLWAREKREHRKRVLIKAVLLVIFVGMGIYAYMFSQVISSNRELEMIDTEIASILHQQKQTGILEDEAYHLSERLKQLEDAKQLKEDTLKWFGMLKTSVSRRAKEAYDKNGADEALRILESLKSLSEDEAYAKKNMLRAKLYVEKNDFEQANHFYEKAIMIDDAYVNVYDYASFLMKQNQFKEAKSLYEKLRSYDLSQVQKANVLNKLGILYRKTEQVKDAELVYREALALRKGLAKENPMLYKNDLAWTYNNLGVLYKESNRTKESEKAHLKALSLRKVLMQENPEEYTFHVSCSMHNMGELFSATKREEKAETFFLESLKIRSILVKKNPKKYTPALASTLYELASLYNTLNRYVEAEKYYLEALDLRRTLVKSNPSAYSAVLIDTLDDLATLYEATHKLDKVQNLRYELHQLKGKVR